MAELSYRMGCLLQHTRLTCCLCPLCDPLVAAVSMPVLPLPGPPLVSLGA